MTKQDLRVEINGEIYVPAKTLTGSVSIEAVAKALLRQFWGTVNNDEITEKFEDVYIVLTDSPRHDQGVSWAEFLQALTEESDRNE